MLRLLAVAAAEVVRTAVLIHLKAAVAAVPEVARQNISQSLHQQPTLTLLVRGALLVVIIKELAQMEELEEIQPSQLA
jgi:hypothetical protein